MLLTALPEVSPTPPCLTRVTASSSTLVYGSSSKESEANGSVQIASYAIESNLESGPPSCSGYSTPSVRTPTLLFAPLGPVYDSGSSHKGAQLYQESYESFQSVDVEGDIGDPPSRIASLVRSLNALVTRPTPAYSRWSGEMLGDTNDLLATATKSPLDEPQVLTSLSAGKHSHGTLDKGKPLSIYVGLANSPRSAAVLVRAPEVDLDSAIPPQSRDVLVSASNTFDSRSLAGENPHPEVWGVDHTVGVNDTDRIESQRDVEPGDGCATRYFSFPILE